MSNKEFKEWANSLRNYIYNFLSNFIDDDNLRKTLVSKDYFFIFIRAFIHQSYDYNNNNEELEFLGDKIFSATFSDYITTKYSSLKNNVFSDIFTTYTSNDFFISKNLMFSSYLMINKDIEISHHKSLEADTVEAFNGALFRAGEKIGKGKGFIICSYFTNYLYKNINIDTKSDLRAPKTIIQQIFSQLSTEKTLKKDYQEEIKVEEGKYFRIVLPDSIYNILRDYFPGIKKIIGEGEDNNKNEAIRKAYEDSYKYIISIGLDNDWVDKYKFDMIVENYKHKDELIRKIKRDNIIYFKTKSSTKTSNKEASFLYLVAKYEDGTEDSPVNSHFNDGNKKINFNKLLDLYLQK